jgi:hypothetical protein
MFRTILLVALVLCVMTLIGILLPDNFTVAIDGAIVYFLTYLWALNNIIDTSVLIACLTTLVYFFTGVSLFFLVHWSLRAVR